MDIVSLLSEAVQLQASDLHISVHASPTFRIHGELRSQGNLLTPSETESLARALMNAEQWTAFNLHGELDFSLQLPDTSRFRVNVYRQRGSVSIAARVVGAVVPQLENLGLPPILAKLTEKQNGLVLVTGPTGSGKTTTLAALINHINRTARRHIITLEDPIEYLHHHDQSIINQRQVGYDTNGFAPALRAALRQDPDVILVGEMRDLETISTAITAAETGHLVFATLHTSDAVQTIDRVIDVFPTGQQRQIRIQLASVLQGVVSQRLIRKKDNQGRVAALEILLNTPAVANLIRSEKGHQIRSVMQTSKQLGMQTMDMHLRELLQTGKITEALFSQYEMRMGAM